MDNRTAFARPTGRNPVGKPIRILFACIGNAARSQMAEGFARHYGGSRIEVHSGGSHPAGHLMPEAVEAMREVGIDISGHHSKGFDEKWIREQCDLVVTMGCGDDACPAFVGKKLVDWKLPDPKGMPMEGVRIWRDEIGRRVKALLQSLPPN